MPKDIKLIKDYMNRAAHNALSNKPEGFTEAEKSLGFSSFIYWYLKGMLYKGVGDQQQFSEHFFESPK